MVKEADAAVTHPKAVVVYPHHTAVTDLVTVFSTWWQYLPARFAETKLANLRHLFVVFR